MEGKIRADAFKFRRKNIKNEPFTKESKDQPPALKATVRVVDLLKIDLIGFHVKGKISKTIDRSPPLTPTAS
jgi:hypothetical protein